MVSTRTLLGLGLAVIAVVSLTTIVVVQQMALQRHVLINYYGYVFTEFGDCKPSTGYVFLVLWISVQNVGYDSVPTALAGFGNPYPYYFYLAVGNQQFNGFPLRCQSSNEILPMTNVTNGLTVSGFLTFEVPANFESFTLIYRPPSGNYNVQYVNQGFTAGTVSTATA